MKSRESALRLKRFEVDEKRRKVTSIEVMIRDFEQMALDLDRQITAEEERSGVKDPAHYAYPMFAKAARQRRDNLVTSVADLKAKLDVALREQEDALGELRKVEAAVDDGSGERGKRKGGRPAPRFPIATSSRIPHRV